MKNFGPVLLPFALCLLGASAVAAPPFHLLRNPPELLARGFAAKVGKKLPGQQPGDENKCDAQECYYDLGIRFTEGKIRYPPVKDRYDNVMLRSYIPCEESQDGSGKVVCTAPPEGRFIAPTIRIRPGQTIRMTLRNQLNDAQSYEKVAGILKDTKSPFSRSVFNITNLHAHGLWISPSGNSDNVLLNIKPGVDFQYEYNVPKDHPAGTFWYHPHMHESTAMQVGSGMAGALIIEGSRMPALDRNGDIQTPGDIDVLLKDFAPKADDYADVMLFQQIPYACFQKEATGQAQVKTDVQGQWQCAANDVGILEDFSSQFGPGKWGKSGRYTSINGEVQPTFEMKTGRVYRWRLVNAALRESINLRIGKLPRTAAVPESMSPGEERSFVEGPCRLGPAVTQFEIAADGLTRANILPREKTPLQPGYRSDVLFAFREEGSYCVFDDQSPAGGSIANAAEDTHLLGVITVKKDKDFGASTEEEFIKKSLQKAATAFFRRDPRLVKRVSDDLQGLKTTAFVPHKDVADVEVKGHPQEEAIFYINTKVQPAELGINGKPYEAGHIDHTLLLGTAQEWKLGSKFANHPFHIHVNPFQVVSVKNVAGADVLEGNLDPDYQGLKGAWKDTLLVKQGYQVTVRTRYERYIGDFVLHCHILDHEDQGMMQNVRIALPDGSGGIAPLGHAHHTE